MPDGRLRVACAQLEARDLADREAALAEALDAVGAAVGLGAEIVVLPECTYPGYVLPDAGAAELRDDAEVERLFAEAAHAAGIAVVVGVAQGIGSAAGAANIALLVDAEGHVRLRTAKRFLWDFDRRWFSPGGHSTVAAVCGVEVGAVVCADARLPELARMLAVDGARLLVDPTAWVTTGTDPAALGNPQPEHLIATRALENGVWIAAANKVGVERDAVVYCGRSGIWAPDGTLVASAGSAAPEIVAADIDVSLAGGPPVPRRPELYGALRAARTVAAERAEQPLVPNASTIRAGLLQLPAAATADAVGAELGRVAPVGEALALDLVVATAESEPDDATLATLGRAAGRLLVVGLTQRGRVVGVARVDGATVRVDTGHGPLEERIFDVEPFRVAAMLGEEGLLPEVCRTLALGGAELVLWLADADAPRAVDVLRTRALENRVYAALLAPTTGAVVADPDGRVVAAGFPGRRQLVPHVLQLAATRFKQMAPGSDILEGRTPEEYDVLAAVGAPA